VHPEYSPAEVLGPKKKIHSFFVDLERKKKVDETKKASNRHVNLPSVELIIIII